MSLAAARLATPCGRIWRLYAAFPTKNPPMGLQRGGILPAAFWPRRATRSDSEASSAMAAATPVNRQWRLKSRPTGLIKADNFELVSQPMPVPEEAQLLIRSVYLSLDPAMRGWLIDRPSYVPPVQIGDIMRGLAIGIVEKSNHPKFAAGDRVQGMFGWQEYLLSNGEAVTKLPEGGLPFSTYLGLFGLAGVNAPAGLFGVG